MRMSYKEHMIIHGYHCPMCFQKIPHIFHIYCKIVCVFWELKVRTGFFVIAKQFEISHDNVMTSQFFTHYCPFVRGIHWSLVDSPHIGPIMQGFDVFFVVNVNMMLNKQSIFWWFHTTCWSFDKTVIILYQTMHRICYSLNLSRKQAIRVSV